MTKDVPLQLLYDVFKVKVHGKTIAEFATLILTDVISAYNAVTPLSNYAASVVAAALSGSLKKAAKVIEAQLKGDANRTMDEVARDIAGSL